ncbi:MAG: transpeptidase family protein [Bacteroidetes bacterium]|nr:transpeptidase family protein [Bacteroidota bacterium]MBL0137966.1 transpeptidase family protein [Bacteroidota bacterium]
MKKDILWRIYLAFLLICAMGLAIIVQIVRIQFVQGDEWRAKQDSMTLSFEPIEASRGNIFSDDGSLLATSVPIYDIRFDTRANSLTDEVFNAGIDSLAQALSTLFKDKTWQDYHHEIKEARSEKNRYYLIQRNVSYTELQQLKKFPILRMGRNKGGLIIDEKNMRQLSFGQLASRTIGTVRDIKPVGVEASFNSDLKGAGGQRLMQRIGGNVKMPVRDKDEVEPRDGNDLVTTLDINIQDVAEHSLEQHLREHNADHGCAVLMEVSTGAIKAIANLSRTKEGEYVENFNYAIAEASEPGSTFKLASLMAALQDGLIELTDTVNVGDGTATYYGKKMPDAHAPKSSKLSIQQAFETSSNVGISRVIYQHYLKSPEAFVSRLKSFGLSQKLGLQIEGEGQPFIKNVTDKSWSGLSLPWISIGYESKLTPLQTLTFYNAVANNGRVVKPMFVSKILNHGKVIREFSSEIIRDSIASPDVLAKARQLLEGVVQRGTASVLNKSPYKIAGKTGTAQIFNNKYGYDKEHMTYQASFVGYFPADKPKYSCIVVVYAPSNDVYYGGAVAAPIFKEIADKVYSNHLDMNESPIQTDSIVKTIPVAKAGQQKDLNKVLAKLNLTNESSDPDAYWVSVDARSAQLKTNERKTISGLVPNVVGMGLRDALYILENAGLNVRINGKGWVTRQSIQAGSRVKKGQQILIELS